MLRDNLSPTYATQLVALGMLIADAERRWNVPPSWFSDRDFQISCEALRLRKKDVELYAGLRRVLGDCGIEWEPRVNGEWVHPATAILDALKRDGEFTRYLSILTEAEKDAIHPSGYVSPLSKTDFLERLRQIETIANERARLTDGQT